MGSDTLDIAALRGWIGRESSALDQITPELVRRHLATLAHFQPCDLGEGEAPPGIHWCLSPQVVPTPETGIDGHPRRGGFVPPVPLPFRMWSGSRLAFHEPLRIGDEVTRHSRIEQIEGKQGRSGPLCFVTVAHRFITARGLAMTEDQGIVFRGPAPKGEAAKADSTQAPTGSRSGPFRCGSVDLFRFSALTFNGHRIHYDRDHARTEGHPDLVVHGPLQATLMLRRAVAERGRLPARYEIRGLRPLYREEAFFLATRPADGGLELAVEKEDGLPTMTARARW
ncbi:MAG: MaoC family dehydratase N-terminal domain-containing protein [Alphaproteobacteria bacterium]|nr:MaoC family dehydratase N-terminal domain-containing protein [Alphaproteobacteria bacterium]